jgi:transcriptional regulator with XRE-family HTH domain
MEHVRSFKEYISDRFYNEFCAAAGDIIDRDWDSFNITCYKLNRPGKPEIEDVTVEHVWVNDEPGSEIQFDCAVSVSLIIRDQDYHYDNEEEKIVWIMARCRGDLDKGLDDFDIFESCPYDGKNKQKKPLDDSLVPYIPEESLEQEAKEILENYYPEALHVPQYNEDPVWVDPSKLAERLGLTVVRTQIKEDCSVFGQIYFEPAVAEVYDAENEKATELRVQAGTILVDPNVFFLRNLGAFNNTVVHECVHWIKHKKAFALARLYNSNVTNISCEVVGGAETAFGGQATEFMEKQANQLAPRIQMPATPFKARANELIGRALFRTNAPHTIDIMEEVIDQLSIDFCVSRQAAKIRMVELGFEEATGTFTYVDDHYVRPHSFRKGTCRYNQTFTISARDAGIQRLLNPELRKLTENGDYLFIENHYVYNAPLYLQYSEDGALELTEYARAHMDECCLLFDMKITSSVGVSYHKICYLNREDSNVTFELTFHNGYENSPQQRQVEYREEQRKEEVRIRKQMTDDPVQCMDLVLKWRNSSYEKLGKIIGCSERTIRRMVHGETPPNKKMAVKICFILNLPPSVSGKLLNTLHCDLTLITEEEQWLDEALHVKYMEPLSAVKRYLAPYHIEL